MTENIMKQIEMEKMVLNCGGVEDKLERSVKLLELITKRKVQTIKSSKRIPDFGISPGKKSGCKVTIRNKPEIISLLKRFFAALDNSVKIRQIADNHLSFGIREYIEIPGLEYNRDIGMLGLDIDLSFKRKGRRVKLRKIKQGKYPKRQDVTKEEIIDFLKKNFKISIKKK
ncbi:50S ribosomal protein L5 [Candidatus Pacearchaeota archaeon]|nr:50S ribosomal protein L5 [Candidatus Pacearchaeota archaeon]